MKVGRNSDIYNKIVVLIILLVSVGSLAQETDTISKTISPYFRVYPMNLLSFTQSSNSMYNDRVSKNLEVGLSYQVLDLGIAYVSNIPLNYDIGLPTAKTIKSNYIEGKLTMDTCQYGVFSNEITFGCGYSVNSDKTYLLEYSTTILAQIQGNLGIGIIVGSYNSTNSTVDFNRTFTGVFLRYGLLRDFNGMLVNKNHIFNKMFKKRPKARHLKL